MTEATKRFVGMFAFAVFDRRERSLHLVRDRVGVKPLYWTIQDGTLLFGSELRALMAHPSFRREVDPDAIAAVVAYSYIPAPATAFKNVFKLPAGAILSIKAGGEPSIERYWRIEDVVAQRGRNRIDSGEAIEALDALLRDSVRRRMVADVPVGAFLSGGIDSSTVVALMQAESNRPVRSFTIGFSDAAYDESEIARSVADHLHTDHTEIRLDAHDALKLVPDIAEWFSEPFADSSQLPTYLVARETRKHVTVALSGDGGDELFAGYPKYAWLDGLWRAAGGSAAAAARACRRCAVARTGSRAETDRRDPARCRARRAHRREIAPARPRLARLQLRPCQRWRWPASASTAISCMARATAIASRRSPASTTACRTSSHACRSTTSRPICPTTS